MRIVLALSSTVLAITLAAACGVAEIPGDGAGAAGDSSDGGASAIKFRSDAESPLPECAPGTAPAPPEKLDPATLPACACAPGGKALCVPSNRLPASYANHLDACAGGSCVPTTLLNDAVANGKATLKTCEYNKAPGRCLSLCVPEVAQESSLTRGDSSECPDDERCVPCANPLNVKESTGICDLDTTIGTTEKCVPTGTAPAGSGVNVPAGAPPPTCPFSGTPGDPTQFAACKTGGRCLPNALIPADLASHLDSCNTTDGSPGLCTPEIYVTEQGKHLPTQCRSFAGIEGRCFSTIFNDVAKDANLLQQDACKSDERCVPCFNPADGTPTGFCNTVECDAPKQTPLKLQDCCNRAGAFRAKCAPRTDVPQQYWDRLEQMECPGGDLCVPSDQISVNSTTVFCDGGDGVCLADCLSISDLEGFFGGIDRGSCAPGQNCIPCDGFFTGSTGAPGCR